MFDETCGNCHHFHGPENKGEMGTCWRYPPEPLSIPMPAPSGAIQAPSNDGIARPGGIMTLAVRPPVTADTLACGEMELPATDEPGDLGERVITPRESGEA